MVATTKADPVGTRIKGIVGPSVNFPALTTAACSALTRGRFRGHNRSINATEKLDTSGEVIAGVARQFPNIPRRIGREIFRTSHFDLSTNVRRSYALRRD